GGGRRRAGGPPPGRTHWRRLLAVTAVTATLLAGCSGGSSSGDQAGPSPATGGSETTVETEATPTTARRGPLSSFDDMNDDGVPDPTCGTRDFKAGLVLRLPCEPGWYANEPSEGTTFVPGSLAALPGLPDDVKAQVLNDVSASAIGAKDDAGKQVVVFFIKSDTLFATGSAALSGPARDTLDGLARNISRTWPAASVQVRGHTDSTGSASVNQTLSEQRAANVATYLASRGIDRARLTSVGLASTAPIVLEDGDAGRTENRRVELVVRIP
ncbi:MAG: OmpA family protein, partial [Actinomycetota bacterium]|nr:OmpA family protein [Actinomycetota bacterium]